MATLIKKISFVGFGFAFVFTFSHHILAESTEEMERALRDAVRNGAIEKIRELHKAGVDLDAKSNSSGYRVIHLAAILGDPKTLRVLGELGVNVELRDKSGYTAIHWAAMFGHKQALRILVNELGADIEAEDNFGYRAVQFTAMFGYYTALRILVSELGANIKVEDNFNLLATNKTINRSRIINFLEAHGVKTPQIAICGY